MARLEIPGYQILGRIGRGAMGSVYKARHIRTDVIVAVKLPHTRSADVAETIERFNRESRAVEMLSHGNIVRAFDAGQIDGRPYYVMEYVEGETVKDRLDRGEILDEVTALKVAVAVSRSIRYMAEEGNLIHRDIKPSNIMLAPDGTVKLADLGLIRSMWKVGWVAAEAGMLIGTLSYMSPEQARGVDDLDALSDVYSLGATLYHMVTGTTPYVGRTGTEVLRKLLDGDEPPVPPRCLNPALSGEFEAVIMAMIARRREDRCGLGTADGGLVHTLESLLTGHTPTDTDGTGEGRDPRLGAAGSFPSYLHDTEDIGEIFGGVRGVLAISDFPDGGADMARMLELLSQSIFPFANTESFHFAYGPGASWDPALAWAREHHPDLILVEPNSIGPYDPEAQFYSQIKSDPDTSDIQIVRAAGLLSVGIVTAMGVVDGFLYRPYSFETFKQVTYTVLKRRRGARASQGGLRPPEGVGP